MFKPFENLMARAEHSGRSPEFSPEQRLVLIGIARDAIFSGLEGAPLPDTPPVAHASPELLALLVEPRGVFTTLYLKGELRGCVGYALPNRPLFRAVGETARAAAFEDSRFWPVEPEEAPGLKISLSVLSRLVAVKAEQIEVGRHGILISDGLRRGLLLPQVPVEHGWDRATFLDQTCRKAGLPADAWRRTSATIEAFEAEVFGEDEAEDRRPM